MDAARRCSALEALDEDERREFWAALALRHMRGLGVRSACLLLRHFGSAYDAVMNVSSWSEADVPSCRAEGWLDNSWRSAARPEWEAARSLQASVILWTDPRYPALLKELPDAPALLYARGDLSLLSSPCVAVVGSRSSFGDALEFTSRVAAELSAAGITVVSGLAFGADGCAHQAALSGPGRTIAVMPGGVDVPFPLGHRGLYGKIAEQALIVSEMPPGHVPGPGAFPVRNRIISGLCLGVLVTEAVDVRSGSLITARLAAEQGRNVYVLSPDLFRHPCGEGTKKLLMDGARPVYGASDILADLFPHLKDALAREETGDAGKTETPEIDLPFPAESPEADDAPVMPAEAGEERSAEGSAAAPLPSPSEGTPEPAVASSPRPLPVLTEEEETILSLLRRGPFSQDDLLHAAQEQSPSWNSASVSAVLMILEVKKLARRLRDSRYEAAL